MQELPHQYSVAAVGEVEGDVVLESEGLPALATAAPVEFGGPGGRWSPEALLVGAVADCFVLTFRAVARLSKLPWSRLRCGVEGTLDRADGGLRFTEIVVRASLWLPGGTDGERAARLLERAEASCLVTRSLNAEVRLETEIRTVAD